MTNPDVLILRIALHEPIVPIDKLWGESQLSTKKDDTLKRLKRLEKAGHIVLHDINIRVGGDGLVLCIPQERPGLSITALGKDALSGYVGD